MTHESGDIRDTDFIDEGPASPPPAEPPPAKPADERKKGLFQFEVHMHDPSHHAPPVGSETDWEMLERVKRENAEFLEAVQRSLPSFGLKAGGRATDFRALKHWTKIIRGPGEPPSSFDTESEKKWKNIEKTYGPVFDAENADENDFVVIIEYPTGEQAALHVRRVLPE